jgi:hypothetical protein
MSASTSGLHDQCVWPQRPERSVEEDEECCQKHTKLGHPLDRPLSETDPGPPDHLSSLGERDEVCVRRQISNTVEEWWLLLMQRQLWVVPLVQGNSDRVRGSLGAVEGRQAILDGNGGPMNIDIVPHESSIVKWPQILLIFWYRTHDVIG